jgi:hypothetical protein
MRTISRRMAIGVAALGTAGLGITAGAVAVADDGSSPRTITARLSGYQEDPMALSTTGSGSIRLRINPGAETIDYTLRYKDLEGAVLQAHIHLGGMAQSDGVSAFLCSNLPSPPAGTPACPAPSGTVSGTLEAADVIGPSGQGIAAGEMGELIDAIQASTTYANVHSDKYPGGEIRSQLDAHGNH